MAYSVRHFIGLFRAELEDLLDDVQHIEERWKTRYDSDEITSYVYQENNAFFQLEYESVEKFIEVIKSVKVEEFKDIEEVQAHILKLAEDFVSRFEEPQAVMTLLKRKIDKVRTYLSINDGPLD